MKAIRKKTRTAKKRRITAKGPGNLASQLLRLAFYHCKSDHFLRMSGLLFREA
jgi:hypothetical protein